MFDGDHEQLNALLASADINPAELLLGDDDLFEQTAASLAAHINTNVLGQLPDSASTNVSPTHVADSLFDESRFGQAASDFLDHDPLVSRLLNSPSKRSTPGARRLSPSHTATQAQQHTSTELPPRTDCPPPRAASRPQRRIVPEAVDSAPAGTSPTALALSEARRRAQTAPTADARQSREAEAPNERASLVSSSALMPPPPTPPAGKRKSARARALAKRKAADEAREQARREKAIDDKVARIEAEAKQLVADEQRAANLVAAKPIQDAQFAELLDELEESSASGEESAGSKNARAENGRNSRHEHERRSDAADSSSSSLSLSDADADVDDKVLKRKRRDAKRPLVSSNDAQTTSAANGNKKAKPDIDQLLELLDSDDEDDDN